MATDDLCKKTVLIIGTGGTISAVGTNLLDFYDYPMSGTRLTSEELKKLVSEPLDDVNLIASGFQPVSSTELGPVFWGKLLN